MTDQLPLGELIGRSAALEAVRIQVRRLARVSDGARLPPVLLLGETGTGKSMLAGLLHRAVRRATGPFVDVNCGAIPETLLEAELFGFERGAFTDARTSKPGLFETAHRGTLFLDEIGALPEALQVKLLTAIESRRVRRLGSTRSQTIDVWIIAATSRDLPAAMRAGRFREDLYHRLSTVVLELPPLRSRAGDVLEIADHVLARAAAEHGIPVKQLSDDARDALRAHPWPGNIRELSNVLERVMLLEDDPIITAAMLTLDAGGGSGISAPAPVSGWSREAVRTKERQRLIAALEASRGNIAAAARRLGIHRNTLQYRLTKHGVTSQGGAKRDQSRHDPLAVVGEPTQSPVANTIRWEQRLVAVLGVTITALVGASLLEATAVMTDLVDMVTSFGARIEQFSPSELLAVFGLEPMEDAARRAVLAALAMRQAVRRSSEDKHAQFAVHVGSYLIARAGTITGLETHARREATDIVSGLLGRAGLDDVVVDPAAARFLERQFVMEALDGDPPAPARVVGRPRRGVEAIGAARSPFVGRSRDLESIGELMARAAGTEPQIVGVVGEPGVGKSRLVFELTHSERIEGWLVLETGSASDGTAARYRPLAELVRSYFGVSEADTPREIQEKLTGRLLTLDRALEPVLPALFSLLELPVDDPGWQRLDPAQRLQKTLDGLRRILRHESRIRPLLVVFEDLHWADAESRAFLDVLVDGLATTRVMLLTTYRPEYHHTWGDRPNFTGLHLDPLPAASAGELLDVLMGRDAVLEPLKQLLTTTTGRNPLFIEESIRTLVETGALVGERGGYRLTRPVNTIQVPATVQAMLAARIDRLPARDKRLLEIASVIGKDVPFALLATISEASEADLLQCIARLQAAEFLYEAGPSLDAGYTFKHALTYQVAYDGVLPEQRRALHARIVAAIETLYADRLTEHVERLAHHAVRAEMPRKALLYLRRAGLKALERSANRDAVGYFEQALAALAQLPETRETLAEAIDLRFELRLGLAPLGEFARVLGCLREAEGLARTLDDQARLGELFDHMCYTLYITGHPREALDFGHRAKALAETLGDAGLEAQANLHGALAFLVTGNSRRAEECLLRALQILETERSRRSVPRAEFRTVMVRNSLTLMFADRGAFEVGLAHGREGLRLAESLDDPYTVADSCMRLAHLHIVRGYLDDAARLLDQGVSVSREWNLTFYSAWLAASQGYVYTLEGRVGEGVRLLEQELGTLECIGYGVVQPRAMIYLGEAYLRGNRLQDALEIAGRALGFTRERGQRVSEAHALRLLGEVTTLLDGPERAGRHYDDALALAEKLELRPLAAHCHLGLGRLWRRRGMGLRAQEHLSTALAMYREMNMTRWLREAREGLQ